tara:strand:+ start:1019 stop:3139 length:2121 start_codon:yes stop_codon:yes gene_type:complete
MNEDENLSEEGLQDPYESELKKAKEEENKRIEEAKDDLTEGKIRRKRTEEEDPENNLLGSRLLDQIEKPIGSALNWFMEKSRPDDSTYLDEVLQRVGGATVGAGLGSYGGLKGSLIGAITGGVLGFDRTTQTLGKIPGVQQLGKAQDFVADVAGKPFEAVGVDPRFGGWAARIGTDFAFDRGVRTGLSGARRTILNNHYARTYTPNTDLFDPAGSVGAAKLRRGNPNWRPNLQQLGYFPDTIDAASQFSKQQIDDLMERARLHRVGREADGKLELMGKFDGFIETTRPDGTSEIGIVIRRRKIADKETPTSSANYQVKTLSQLMKQMRVETKWMTNQASTEVKEMKIIVSKLNQLGKDHPDALLAKLMEFGDGSAYLEHKIGKSQFGWLWDLKEADPKNYPWIEALERNDAKNLRLLVNKAYKKLKDTTETRIVAKYNNKLIKEKKFKDAYIVNIEDPMNNPYSSLKTFHKSNPGHLIIQTASKGDKTPKTIGVIGDYLQDFYSPEFVRNYNGNKLLTIFEQMSPENKKIFSLYKPKTTRVKGEKGYFNKVESATKYRDRVLRERIDLIIKEKGNFSYQDIQKEVFIDMLNFYELFAKKAHYVRRPEYITDAIRRAKSQRQLSPYNEPYPWSYKRFMAFHDQKRAALKDLYGSILDYEAGRTPRMTKKDFNNLWKQIYEISTLDYNFNADVNDIADKLREITSKYE